MSNTADIQINLYLKRVFAVTSPGIPPHSEIIKKLKYNRIKTISELEFASQENNENKSQKQFITITGTNGKTTTTALTEFILQKPDLRQKPAEISAYLQATLSMKKIWIGLFVKPALFNWK